MPATLIWLPLWTTRQEILLGQAIAFRNAKIKATSSARLFICNPGGIADVEVRLVAKPNAARSTPTPIAVMPTHQCKHEPPGAIPSGSGLCSKKAAYQPVFARGLWRVTVLSLD